MARADDNGSGASGSNLSSLYAKYNAAKRGQAVQPVQPSNAGQARSYYQQYANRSQAQPSQAQSAYAQRYKQQATRDAYEKSLPGLYAKYQERKAYEAAQRAANPTGSPDPMARQSRLDAYNAMTNPAMAAYAARYRGQAAPTLAQNAYGHRLAESADNYLYGGRYGQEARAFAARYGAGDINNMANMAQQYTKYRWQQRVNQAYTGRLNENTLDYLRDIPQGMSTTNQNAGGGGGGGYGWPGWGGYGGGGGGGGRGYTEQPANYWNSFLNWRVLEVQGG